jgi:hypothetical protein
MGGGGAGTGAPKKKERKEERVQSARTTAREKANVVIRGHICKKTSRNTATEAHDQCLCGHAHNHTHGATVNWECLLQEAQAGKRVFRQSRQGVVVKLELPVGEEEDTRSGALSSTRAQTRK